MPSSSGPQAPAQSCWAAVPAGDEELGSYSPSLLSHWLKATPGSTLCPTCDPGRQTERSERAVAAAVMSQGRACVRGKALATSAPWTKVMRDSEVIPKLGHQGCTPTEAFPSEQTRTLTGAAESQPTAPASPPSRLNGHRARVQDGSRVCLPISSALTLCGGLNLFLRAAVPTYRKLGGLKQRNSVLSQL